MTQVDPSLTQVLDHIRLNNRISYAKLGQILNISPSTAKRLLQKLKDKGIVRRVGQINSRLLGDNKIAEKASKMKPFLFGIFY